MSMKYIRDYYGVPAKRGARVRFTGESKPLDGTITSARGPHLCVRFDGGKHTHILHPTWELEYLATEPESDTE